jgi:protein involved in polysaccharide export with SLBB domain
MRVCLWIVLWMLTPACLGADDTNVVSILRQFIQELDRRERGEILPPVEGPSVALKPPPPVERPVENAPVEPAERRLRPGDLLKVEVVDEPNMSTNRVAVAEDGTVRLPIAGQVVVGGKSLEEATVIVRDHLGADYLVNPRVKLTLVAKPDRVAPPPPPPKPEPAEEIWPGVPAPSVQAVSDDSAAPNEPEKPKQPEKPVESEVQPPPEAAPAPKPARCQFTISNQVRKPGRYQWACDQRMTLLRAIGMAGGATARADLSRVTIRRMVEGKQRELLCDLPALVLDPEAQAPVLQPGDEVELPRK